MHESENQIQMLLETHEEILLGKSKKNLDLIYRDTKFLMAIITAWDQAVEAFLTIIPDINSSKLGKGQVMPATIKFAETHTTLLQQLKILKEAVVPASIFHIVEEVQKEISATLNDTYMILLFFSPNHSDRPNSEIILEVTKQSLDFSKSKIRRLQKAILNSKPGQEPSTEKGRGGILSRFEQFILSQKTQTWLWFLALIALILFGVTDSDFETRVLFYRNFAKLFILCIALWFPIVFILSPNINVNYFLYGVGWAIVAAILCYGLFLGLLISFILFVRPISQLIISKDTNSSQRLEKQYVLPTALALLGIGVILTHESIWIIGLTIWITFYGFLRATSYEFFRQNFDMLEEIFPDSKSRQQRSRFFVGSVLLSTLLITTGIVGQVDPDFLITVYTTINSFSLALVTILLAVQAIIPGMTVWSHENAPRKRIREMRFMIRANKGLGGFMSSFFFLLLISFAGWMITTRVLVAYPIAFDLSLDNSVVQTKNIFDQLNPFNTHQIVLIQQTFKSWNTPSFSSMVFAGSSTVSVQHTVQYFSSLLFVACICLGIHALFQLYYLFSTASIFLLPIQDALLSQPVEIEKVNNNLLIKNRDELENQWRKVLKSERRLNGHLISEINITPEIEDNEAIRGIVIYEMDFVTFDEILKTSCDTFRALFDGITPSKESMKLRETGVAVFRDSHKYGRQNIFSLQINRDEWEFIKKEIPGFTLEYKVRDVLKAKIVGYVFPDAQVF